MEEKQKNLEICKEEFKVAKKLKFPLVLKDGYQVRTLEEMREHFDLEKVLNYYQNGKLLIWLSDRCYEKELKELQSINGTSPDLAKRLCDIFGVFNTSIGNINLEEMMEKQERLERLKQYTFDTEILDHIKQVAFDQEELAELLDEGCDVIYLCGNKFRIPLKLHNKHYIGVGKAKVVLTVDSTYDFKTTNIKFTNIDLIDSKGNPFSTVSIKEAEQLYYSAQFQQAAPLLEKLIEKGNNKARCILGEMYMYSSFKSFPYDFNKGYELVCVGANEGDILCVFWKASHTTDGFKNVYDDLLQGLINESKSGDALALYSLASYYEEDGNNKNLELATKYYHESEKAGYWRAYRALGWNYRWGRGVPVDYYKAKEYYLKLAELDDSWAKIRLGELLFYQLNSQEEGVEWYRKGYTPETLKRDIQKLVERIDSLKEPYSSITCTFSSASGGEYSTKSEAERALQNIIRRDCEHINSEFYKEAQRLANIYMSNIQNLLWPVTAYMRICNNNEVINIEEIKSFIGEYAIKIVPNYLLNVNNCTYTIDSNKDMLLDFGFSLAQKRYHLTYWSYEAFGEKYGLDYRTNGRNYAQEVYQYAKKILQPVKEILFYLNTEVIA